MRFFSDLSAGVEGLRIDPSRYASWGVGSPTGSSQKDLTANGNVNAKVRHFSLVPKLLGNALGPRRFISLCVGGCLAERFQSPDLFAHSGFTRCDQTKPQS